MTEEKIKDVNVQGTEEAENVKANDEAKATEDKAEAVQDEAAKAEEQENSAKAGPDDKVSADEEPQKDETKSEEADDTKYLRLMAEFQNYKKRVAKEKTDIHAYANEKIIVELLEVLDNFERALNNENSAESEAFVKGMRLIFDQLNGVLTKSGLKEIEALGEEFDPNYHNAVMTEDSEKHESNKVCKVLQKGYSLNDKVIRPAMVTVSK